MDRKTVYFVSDVHLGLKVNNPAEREERFVFWLKSIPRETAKAVYLLGDIWDFWFEYSDVIPREGIRVVAQLIDLIDAGVDVFFFDGNHDMWSFSFFESIGIRKPAQPFVTEIGGRVFCMGHGDSFGKMEPGYKVMHSVFHSRVAQKLFSILHPRLAYRLGLGWSCSNRASHKPYSFRGEEESLYKFALEMSSKEKIDYFVFGHFHDMVDMTLPDGARFVILKDWISGGMPYAVFNGSSFELYSGDDPK